MAVGGVRMREVQADRKPTHDHVIYSLSDTHTHTHPYTWSQKCTIYIIAE